MLFGIDFLSYCRRQESFSLSSFGENAFGVSPNEFGWKNCNIFLANSAGAAQYEKVRESVWCCSRRVDSVTSNFCDMKSGSVRIRRVPFVQNPVYGGSNICVDIHPHVGNIVILASVPRGATHGMVASAGFREMALFAFDLRETSVNVERRRSVKNTSRWIDESLRKYKIWATQSGTAAQMCSYCFCRYR